MLEIEKKFILTDDQVKALTDGAVFLGEKVFTDTYFDDGSYSLTRKDLWLRDRDGRFELKIPLNVRIEDRVSDQYKELETDEEIAAYFNWSTDKPLRQAIEDAGYFPFCTITTTRQKYEKDGFGLDFDGTDFGYNVAEIELMVEDDADMAAATQKILDYAKSHDLSDRHARGKVAEFLKIKNPEHLQILIDEKVIK